MQLQYIPYVLPLLVTTAVSAALALHAWRRRSVPSAASCALLMLAAAEWSLGYAFELWSPDLPSKLFWGNVAYLGVVVVPVAWLAFGLQYTGREKCLTRRNVALLSIVPLATLLLIWSNDLHGLFYSSTGLTTSGPLLLLDLAYGAWFWVDIAYEYLLILLGTLLLLQAFVRSPRPYRGQVGTLLIGAFIPWVAEVLSISGLSPLAPLDLTPFAFTLSGLVFAWGLFRYGLLDIVPAARGAVIEGMSDGVIVLDTQNRIVDLNPAAERIIGRRTAEAIGQPINIEDWGSRIVDLEAQNFHSEIHIPQSATTFDLRISPLYDRRGCLTGRLVVLRDITGRKRAEEALRESRERLRAVVTGAPIVLFATDGEGVLTLLEGKGLEAVGAQPGAGIGHSVFDVLRDLPQVGEDIRRALGGKEITSIVELAGRTFETLCSPLRASDSASTADRIVGVIGVATDITGRLLESEERYRNLFEGVPIGLYRTASDGRILDANLALVEMLGYPNQASLLTVNVADTLVNPEDRRRWRALMEREGVVRDFEMQIRRYDGEVIWVEDTAHTVRDVGDGVLYYEGSLEDITQRKQVEEALRESEKQFRDLYENAPNAYFSVGADGLIRRCNRRAGELLGYAVEELVGQPVFDLYADTPQGKMKASQVFEQFQAGETIIDEELQMQKADGTQVWISLTVSAVRDARGQVVESRPMVVDITERKRMEGALQESRVQLERSHRELADRVAALETVHRVGVAMSSRLETDALLHFIVEQAAKLTDATSCSILLPDETTGELVFRAADALVVGMRVPPGQGVAARAFRECTPQIVHDVTTDPDHYATIGQECDIPTRSLLAVPLLVGDRASGVLEAINKRQGRFTEQDRDLLMTLASHAAIAIENARLYEDARRRLAEVELVQEVMLGTASTLDFDLALERTIKALHRALGFDYLGFLLPNEQGDRLVSHPSLVSPAEDVCQIPVEGSLAGRAYRTGQLVWARDLEQESAYSDQAPEIRSALAVPVRVGDRVIAVLHAGSPQVGAFGKDELRLFATVAAQLGVTLENARLHERVQRHAVELEERVRQRTFDLQVLHDLSREIGQIRSFDELVRLVLENLYHAMPHDVSASVLVTGDRCELLIQPTRPLAPAVQEEIQGRLISTLGRIRGEEIGMEQGEVLSQTPSSEAFDTAQPPMMHLGSAFHVPLIVGQEIVGLLFVGSEQEEAFSEDQMRLLYTMANEASLFLSIRRSEEALQHRAKLETLIADVSTLFVRLPPEELDTGMESALRAVGEFAAADRGYILLLSDGGTRGDNIHEWCAEGIAPQMENRKALRVERFPWLAERLSQVITVHAPRIKVAHLPRVADLPPEAKVEKEFLQSQGVQSLVAVPMIYGGTLIGFIGFDAVRAEKRWTEDVIALLGIVGDICVNALERTRAQEQIEASLREKEVLLQEIHHRVKNNLQVVSSLLDLQSGYVEDEQTKQMLKESRSRVRSMALIHEKLYRSGDLARIDFSEYVQSLADNLFRSYRTQAAGATLSVNVEDVLLDVDKAIPCGLIINELVSNALKYAFPDGREGEICVELFSENGAFSLVVRDDGVGFPEEMDFRKTESLGLRLVVTLVKQIGGTIELDRSDGTAFRIKFAEGQGSGERKR